jgi:hypothetical protein
VKLKRPGRYTITHREGYLRLSKEDAFERAILSPFGIGSQNATLPVSLVIDDSQSPVPDKAAVSLRVVIPLSRALFLPHGNGPVARLHVYVSLFDTAGQPVGFHHYVETLADRAEKDADLVVSKTMPLPKGSRRIFVIVRDELSDQVGVASREIGF